MLKRRAIHDRPSIKINKFFIHQKLIVRQHLSSSERKKQFKNNYNEDSG